MGHKDIETNPSLDFHFRHFHGTLKMKKPFVIGSLFQQIAAGRQNNENWERGLDR